MFSIVICSVNEQLLVQVKNNIAATIGIDYEILWWNNKNKRTGLCEVYNTLAAKARYPYLVFCHEDILFKTKDWGRELLFNFNLNTSISLIGVAGCKYKSKAFSGWYSGINSIDCFDIVHHVNGQDIVLSSGGSDATVEEVVCIDGVFMACTKAIWQQVKFNEEQLKGFHFYDIDFSLRVAEKKKVAIARNIQIIHITQGGDYGDRWVEAAFTFHENSKVALPFYKDDVPLNTQFLIEKNWLDRLKTEPISLRNKLLWVGKQSLYLKPALWYSLLKFLLYRPLGLQRIHGIAKRKTI